MAIAANASKAASIENQLVETRTRTIALMALAPDDELNRRVHWFYSPIGWHLGHAAMIEEHWVLVRALGQQEVDPALTFLFANIPENPKDNRVRLPSRQEILSWMSEVRSRVLAALPSFELSTDPLRKDNFAVKFSIQHERQHQETIVELLQLLGCLGSGSPLSYKPSNPPLPQSKVPAPEMIAVAGGEFMMGTDHLHAYDNEKQPHSVHVRDYKLSNLPVTAGEFIEFIADGCYAREDLWTDAGRQWVQSEDVSSPEYWRKTDGVWTHQTPVGLRRVDTTAPVCSISWFEADAFAKWKGTRLPTEAEWEYASSVDPETGVKSRYPWGDAEPCNTDANFGVDRWGPCTAGAFPSGAAPCGALDMAGQVWEWTATPFAPYPGFRPWPYDGYSHEHMDGTFFVCRGGSWASHSDILRTTFRNWYPRGYRQGLMGFRLAADV